MKIQKIKRSIYKEKLRKLAQQEYRLTEQMYYIKLGMDLGDNKTIGKRDWNRLNERLRKNKEKQEDLVFNTVLI